MSIVLGGASLVAVLGVGLFAAVGQGGRTAAPRPAAAVPAPAGPPVAVTPRDPGFLDRVSREVVHADRW